MASGATQLPALLGPRPSIFLLVVGPVQVIPVHIGEVVLVAGRQGLQELLGLLVHTLLDDGVQEIGGLGGGGHDVPFLFPEVSAAVGIVAFDIPGEDQGLQLVEEDLLEATGVSTLAVPARGTPHIVVHGVLNDLDLSQVHHDVAVQVDMHDVPFLFFQITHLIRHGNVESCLPRYPVVLRQDSLRSVTPRVSCQHLFLLVY